MHSGRIGGIRKLWIIRFAFQWTSWRCWPTLTITGKSMSEAPFLHHLTHNMTTDCSLNFKFNTWKFQAQTWGEHVVYRNCFWHAEQFLYATCFPHVLQKRRATDKDSSISTYFSTASSLSMFFINQPLILQKTKPLYANPK